MRQSTSRREQVLAMIVSHYIETAEPVSSRCIAMRLGLSSATIRNVMADLEDLGLITHPHTSAGRVPTDKGYRYYIDSLMRLRRMNEHIASAIYEQYHQAVSTLEDILEKTSRMISSLTNYVGVTFFSQASRVYLDGTSHFVEQPEFKDFRKLHNVLKYLEERTEILNLLSADIDERLVVHIGGENRPDSLKECSIISRGYKVRGKSAGRLGVIGPKRMSYDKVIPAVEFMADTLTRVLDEIDR
jgi:transcriptional regulator of heat shock response